MLRRMASRFRLPGAERRPVGASFGVKFDGDGEPGFGAAAYERLARRVDAALRKARARGRVVVAGVTVPIQAGVDPLARVAAARLKGERWSYFAQPARDGTALATLGEAAVVTASGERRFIDISRRCAGMLDAAEIDDPGADAGAPPGAGAVWVGGFAFFDAGPFGDLWREFESVRFALPEVSLARVGDRARMSVNVALSPDDDAASALARVEDLVELLRLGSDDADHVGDDFVAAVERIDARAAVSSSAPAEHYERAVGAAVDAIARGELEKVVLARELVVRHERPIQSAKLLAALRARFPECTTFAIGGADTVFLGATPELLIRREGRRASTLALAGSTRRGADRQTDEHLGEQLLASAKNNHEHALVARRIERTLGRLSAWTAVGERPELVKMKNIQHLATPIRAQLTEPRPVIELAGLLHPTPAVGGEPWPKAASIIRELEGFDRGWYAGGVGWMDRLEDGEFHVALRSALVEGAQARLFAGAGVVAESQPESELRETETKFMALLPILAPTLDVS